MSGKFSYTVIAFGVEVPLSRAAELVGSYLEGGGEAEKQEMSRSLSFLEEERKKKEILDACSRLHEEEEPFPAEKLPPGGFPMLALLAKLAEESASKEGLVLTSHYGHRGWISGVFFVLQERQVLVENDRETGFVPLEEAASPDEEIYRFRSWAGRVLRLPVRMGVFFYQD